MLTHHLRLAYVVLHSVSILVWRHACLSPSLPFALRMVGCDNVCCSSLVLSIMAGSWRFSAVIPEVSMYLLVLYKTMPSPNNEQVPPNQMHQKPLSTSGKVHGRLKHPFFEIKISLVRNILATLIVSGKQTVTLLTLTGKDTTTTAAHYPARVPQAGKRGLLKQAWLFIEVLHGEDTSSYKTAI